MKNLLKNFFLCGITGWCVEIFFTSIYAFRRRNLKLIGNTSIWMFPIYGLACLIEPVYHLIYKLNWMLRGTIYMVLIYICEFLTGKFLMKYHLCPWDYSRSKWNINKVIRLDFAPFWFILGLIYEKLLHKSIK